MPAQSLKGIAWPNIVTAFDHSIGQAYCMLHLQIDLENADVIKEVNAAIVKSAARGDTNLAALKKILRRELKRAKRDNKGNLRIVNAVSAPSKGLDRMR